PSFRQPARRAAPVPPAALPEVSEHDVRGDVYEVPVTPPRRPYAPAPPEMFTPLVSTAWPSGRAPSYAFWLTVTDGPRVLQPDGTRRRMLGAEGWVYHRGTRPEPHLVYQLGC